MKTTLKEYCELHGKSLQIASRYAKEYFELENESDPRKQKKRATRLKWFTNVESIHRDGWQYSVVISDPERARTEDRIQQEYVLDFRNRFCLEHHSPRYCIFSVPNEGKDVVEQTRKLQTGLLPGVSDCIVLLPELCIFCETKTPDGDQSPDQVKFEYWVKQLGFEYIIVRSTEEFYKKLSEVLVKKDKSHLIKW